jgi:hypothetical protein
MSDMLPYFDNDRQRKISVQDFDAHRNDLDVACPEGELCPCIEGMQRARHPGGDENLRVCSWLDDAGPLLAAVASWDGAC